MRATLLEMTSPTSLIRINLPIGTLHHECTSPRITVSHTQISLDTTAQPSDLMARQRPHPVLWVHLNILFATSLHPSSLQNPKDSRPSPDPWSLPWTIRCVQEGQSHWSGTTSTLKFGHRSPSQHIATTLADRTACYGTVYPGRASAELYLTPSHHLPWLGLSLRRRREVNRLQFVICSDDME